MNFFPGRIRVRVGLQGLFPPRRPPPGLTGTISDIEDELILERGNYFLCIVHPSWGKCWASARWPAVGVRSFKLRVHTTHTKAIMMV